MADEPARMDRLEIASAIILLISALASAAATYEAGLWDGEQAAHYSRANTLRVEASQAALEGDVVASAQMRVFDAWLQAKARKEDALAGFYEARMPPGFKPAFTAWLAEQPLQNPSAPESPFVTPGYQRPGRDEAARLDAEAAKAFANGQYANSVSDAYQQGAALLAIALFFGGIVQIFRVRGARVAMLAIASLATVAGLLRLLTLPVQVLGWHAPS